MSNLSCFFDRSEFVARPISSNLKNVKVDEEYSLELQVFDVLALDTPAVVTSILASSDGRSTTVLPVTVNTSEFGRYSYLFQFTIPTADWDGKSSLVLELSITDHEAYVYKLQYKLKV